MTMRIDRPRMAAIKDFEILPYNQIIHIDDFQGLNIKIVAYFVALSSQIIRNFIQATILKFTSVSAIIFLHYYMQI